MQTWVFGKKVINSIEDMPDDVYGFVYMITNLKTGKKYIGRKTLFNRRKYKVNTKSKSAKKKKKTKVVYRETDWKTYTGSSEELNEEIEKLGRRNFSFEILHFAFTKGQLNYLEENTQHKKDVLTSKLPSGEPEFYNNCIGSRRFLNANL